MKVRGLLALAMLVPAVTASAGELLIDARLSADGALEVSYTPPAGIRELPFWNASPDAHERWRGRLFEAADECTELTGSGLRLKAACTTARLRIKPGELSLDAVYEPAQPLSDGSGVLLYTGHYAVLLPGHGLRWRWHSPADGYVLQHGGYRKGVAQEFVPAAEVDQALQNPSARDWAIGADQMVFIGHSPVEKVAGGWLVLDPGIDHARAAQVRAALLNGVDSLGQAYGQPLDEPFAVIAAASPLAGFHGDTSRGQMMRLRLPQDAASVSEREMAQLISHEVAHWWNAGVFQSDPEQAWLHEGNAEWVARLLMLKGGQLSLADLHAEIEQALNRCLKVRGDKPASVIKERRNDDPYACGMSLMLAAHAQHWQRLGADGKRTSPLRLIAGLYVRGQSLDIAGFAAWADGVPDGSMSRLLTDPGVGFTDGMARLLADLGLADMQTITVQSELPAGKRRELASGLLTVLMENDCGGSRSFWSESDGYLIDPDLRCKRLQGGQKLQSLAGRSLLDEPIAAWEAVTRACNDAGTVSVGYQNGQTSALECPKPMPPLPAIRWLRLRPEALQWLGSGNNRMQRQGFEG